MKKSKKFIYIIALIRVVHVLNHSIPKGYGTRSSKYTHYYNIKTSLLKKICSFFDKEGIIRYNNYFIKIGYADGVTYFESKLLLFEQTSFHGHYGYDTNPNNIRWNEIRNGPYDSCNLDLNINSQIRRAKGYVISDIEYLNKHLSKA